MTRARHVGFITFAVVAVGLLSACKEATAPVLAPGAPAGSASAAPPQDPRQRKQQMTELGLKHKTAAELYQALKDQAKGGQRLAWSSMPDWSGVYTRTPIPRFAFDPDQPPGGLPPAKLTPEYQARMMKSSRT